MPFCHFSKVNNGMSWSSIKKNVLLQISNGCKKMEYSEIASITISLLEFNIICKDVSNPSHCYLKFTPHSIAGLDGIWHCIRLQNTHDTRRIILYTAGRVHPLYVAIKE